MKKRVLLVDDESSIRRTLTLSLNQEGYDVEPCDTGINALKKLETYEKNDISFDTIILDIKLPDIDGIKLGKIIKSKYPDSIIIFISGYANSLNLKEIANLNSTTFIEKPFTTQDLTYQFDELSKEKGVSTQVAEEENSETVKTVSAYALLKLKKDANFIEIYKELFFMKELFYCDATKGEYDIILLIQSNCIEECREVYENAIKKIDGIENFELLEVEKPILNNSSKNVISTVEDHLSDKNIISESNRDLKNKVSSYVLIEIEREKLETIYPTLRLNENVVYCDYATGKYNIILLVQGTSFNDIDKLIENKISNLDGVLKVKEYPIINIFEM